MTVQGVAPDRWRLVLLSVGSHRKRRPLTPTGVASEFKRAIDAGTRAKELASACHFDGPTMVSRFIRLTELDDEVQHLVDWGSGTASVVPFSAAAELARLHPAEHRRAFAAVLEYGLTSFEVRQLVQSRFRGATSLEAAVAGVVKRRPTVETRTLLIGVISSQDLRHRLEGIDQADRDTLFKKILDSEYGQGTVGKARLGRDRFSILLRPDAVQRVSPAGSDFEQTVSDLIGRHLSGV